jgi:hypothetical protein
MKIQRHPLFDELSYTGQRVLLSQLIRDRFFLASFITSHKLAFEMYT